MTTGNPAMTAIRNFRGTAFGTLAVSNSSGTLVLTGGSGQDFEFKNVGTVEAFVTVGTVAVANAATTGVETSISIPAGAILVYNFPMAPDAATVAFITASGTTTLRAAQGTGS